jgi:tetratricopeptide (TPR) repeat protein
VAVNIAGGVVMAGEGPRRRQGHASGKHADRQEGRENAATSNQAVPQRHKRLLTAMALVVATTLVFGQAVGYDFINFDDDIYVYNNQAVRDGLSLKGAAWAFATFHAGNWHPLTWLSLQADAKFFGNPPAGFHRTNVILHVVNALLVFAVFQHMTGFTGRSAIVAGLFAVHPLHVESVTWVSERKDVLSTLFGMAALYAYARYVAGSRGWYLGVVAALALSLLAKPMLVTFPFLLLLLDYWPLQRWPGQMRAVSWQRLVGEKVPLLLLTIASSMVTVQAQLQGPAVQTLDRFSFGTRLASALLAYSDYLQQALVPIDLVIYYPHPHAGWGEPRVLAAAALVVGISVVFVALRGRFPYLVVGWFWFLGTLVPVIGLVQVENQARADRYTYVPLIGVFLLLTWGVADWSNYRRVPKWVVAAGTLVLIVLCMAQAGAQVGCWKDSLTVWSHALSVGAQDSPVAWMGLGKALTQAGRAEEAQTCFDQALRLNPDGQKALFAQCLTLVEAGRGGEAVPALEGLLRVGPPSAALHAALGKALNQAGRTEEARVHLEAANRLAPKRR